MTASNHITVLMIDDDDGHVELVRRHLARAGFTNPFVGLGSGEQALDYLFRRGAHATRAPDGELLILLDINMPGMDGAEVLRQLKADPRTRIIPVVMLTTTDDPREVQRCYDAGCNIYVTKPVEPAAFMEAIRRLGMFFAIVTMPKPPS